MVDEFSFDNSSTIFHETQLIFYGVQRKDFSAPGTRAARLRPSVFARFPVLSSAVGSVSDYGSEGREFDSRLRRMFMA